MEVELVYAGKRPHKERFLVDNKTTKADGVKLQKTQEPGFTKQWRKYGPLVFIIVATINVGLVIYFVTQLGRVPLSERAAFVTQIIAGTIALAIPFFATAKMWVKIALVTAIELFIAGIFIKAINLVG